MNGKATEQDNKAMFARARDLPSAHLLGAGTSMCSGCGGLEAVREVYDVLGENTIFVNGSNCHSTCFVFSDPVVISSSRDYF